MITDISLKIALDHYINNREKPDINNILTTFKETIQAYDKSGANDLISMLTNPLSNIVKGGAHLYRSATAKVETETKTCPLQEGEIRFRHTFPSGKTPITNVPFEASSGFFSKNLRGETDKEGYGVLTGCTPGETYTIKFYPDYDGSSEKAIDEMYTKIIDQLASILKSEWDTNLSPAWDTFKEKYKNQSELDKIYTSIQIHLKGLWDTMVGLVNFVIEIGRFLVNNWDIFLATTPIGMIYRQFFKTEDNDIEKFLKEIVQNLKAMSPTQREQVFFVLTDKPIIFLVVAGLFTWLCLLPPDQLSAFISRAYYEIVVMVVLAILFPPSVISRISAQITTKVKYVYNNVELGIELARGLSRFSSRAAADTQYILANNIAPKVLTLRASEGVPVIAQTIEIGEVVVQTTSKGRTVVQTIEKGEVAAQAGKEATTTTEIISSNNSELIASKLEPVPTETIKPTTPETPNGSPSTSAKNTATDGEPISMVTGEELLTLTDFELKGLLNFAWKRLYRTSAAEIDGGLGYGWSHSLNQSLIIKENEVHWTNDENITTVLPLPTQKLPFGLNPLAEAAIYLGKNDNEYILSQASGQGLYHFIKTKTGFQLTAISDKYDNRIYINRNLLGKIHRIHNGAGRGLCFEYAGQHIIGVDFQQQQAGDTEEASWKTLQRVTSYEYNSNHQLIKATNSIGDSEHYSYDQNNVIQSRQMAGGATFYWRWQGEGKYARCIEHWANFGQMHTTYDWSIEGTVIVTRKDGSQLFYTHDDAKLVQYIDADGGKTLKAYDELGNLVAERSPLGAETLYQYDGKKLTSIIPPEGEITTYIYDNEQLSRVIKGNAEWYYEYNDQGEITLQLDPQGHTTRYEYTSTGKIKAIYYPDGSQHLLTWNKLGQLIQETTPQGGTRHYRYDSQGNQILRQDEHGQTTQAEYDALGRITCLIKGDKTSQHYRYNAYNKITQITDEQGHVTHYQYADHLHLISQKINPDGSTVHYQYNNPDLNLTDITNEQGEHYHLDYYSNGLISQEIGFDGRKTSYQYDVGGNLVAKTDYDDQGNTYTTTYLRSPTGKLLQKNLPDGKQINYAYNEQGLLQSVDDGHWPLNYEYDITGKLTAEHQGWATLRYQYSPLGILSQCKLPDGNIIDYKHQKGGQLAQVNLNDQKLTEHFYSLGQEVERQQGSLTSQYDYDEQGRLKTHFVNNSQKNLYQRKYQYSANGNLAAIEDSRKGIRQYHYDPLDRLVQVRGDISEDLIHDPAGNLLAQDHKTQHANVKGNRLLMQGDKHFTYDTFGNLIQEARGQGQKLVTQYHYDSQQQLIQATMPEGMSASYQYDAFGRRISKTVLDKTGKKTKTEFIWLGEKLLAESSKGHYQSYLYELGTFKPLALLKGKGKKAEIYYYQLDHLGTPQELTAANGSIAWSAKYKAYGNLALQEQIEGIEQPLRFQGQYHDLETGLYYNHHRYYDSQLGRYITPDPIKLAGGLNSYQYCTNPTGWVDPLGLKNLGGDFGKTTDITPETKFNVKTGEPPKPVVGETTHRNPKPLAPVIETDAYGNEIMYRSMSEKHLEVLYADGVLSATGETSTSPALWYSSRYDGITVRFVLKPGTSAKLQEIGNAANAATVGEFPYLHRPVKGEKWKMTRARFKVEQEQTTTQLGQGKALDIFNDNIIDFQVVEKLPQGK